MTTSLAGSPGSPGPQPPGNLPAETSSFVGRRRDLAEVRRAAERSRLVTLCGVGGVGKTRLALRAATLSAGEATARGNRGPFADGVWLADLSALREAGPLAHTVGDALGLSGRSPGDPVGLLVEHLAARRLLLVLDGCEHLIDPCAMLAEVLVRAAPGLRIIATSREPLDVLGEHLVMVAPLPVRAGAPGPHGATAGGPPGRQSHGHTGGHLDGDAVRLFAERAAAARPGFALTPGNREAVARLCERLDGVPLAIELAAVRAASSGRLDARFDPRLDARLDDPARAPGPRGANGYRHRSLHAAMAWSHGLCSPAEQTLWARLSVFPGDFDLEAAKRVCADGAALPVHGLAGVLARLAGLSVVRYEPERRRYRMPEPVREFGAELLDQAGGDVPARRHHLHYAAVAGRAAAAQLGGDQLGWTRRLDAETGNLRAALEWALGTPGEEEEALRLAVSLRQYWYVTGRFGEGRDWCLRALAATSGTSAERGWAAYGAGLFAVLQGDLGAAEPLLAEAAETAAALGEDDLWAHAVHERGRSAFQSGDLDTALACYREAQAVYARDGHHDPNALTIYPDLGSVQALHGELDAAVAICDEGLRASAATGEQWARSFALWMRGAARLLGGALDEAAEDVSASLRTLDAFGDQVGTAMCLDVLIACAVGRGEFERAAVLSGASGDIWRSLRTPVQCGPHYNRLREWGVDAARAALGEERLRAAQAAGRALPIADAVALGLDPGRAPDLPPRMREW